MRTRNFLIVVLVFLIVSGSFAGTPSKMDSTVASFFGWDISDTTGVTAKQLATFYKIVDDRAVKVVRQRAVELPKYAPNGYAASTIEKLKKYEDALEAMVSGFTKVGAENDDAWTPSENSYHLDRKGLNDSTLHAIKSAYLIDGIGAIGSAPTAEECAEAAATAAENAATTAVATAFSEKQEELEAALLEAVERTFKVKRK